MIELRGITTDDIGIIKNWPSYITETGESIHTIQGNNIEFIGMELDKTKFSILRDINERCIVVNRYTKRLLPRR